MTTEYAYVFILGAILLLFAAAFIYAVYSNILGQMAKNAKNKRLLRNDVTQWTGREYRRSSRR